MKILLTLYFCYILVVVRCYATPLKEQNLKLDDTFCNRGVKFYLYTNENPETPQLLLSNNVNTVKRSNFNNSIETKIIIHGWRGSHTSISNNILRRAFLSKDNFNIIVVDWSKYAKLYYILSRSSVPKVGKVVAEFADFLNQKFRMNFDSLEVIGHSLGAHVAGYCGKFVKRGELLLIVGLDPAFPLFSYFYPNKRLASTDAKDVLTIQTNGNNMGFLRPIGSTAYYPNWGRLQPGCGSDGPCSHMRSVYLFAAAIRGILFDPIYKCNNYRNILNQRGCNQKVSSGRIYDPKRNKYEPGIYYFETKSEAPFGHL